MDDHTTAFEAIANQTEFPPLVVAKPLSDQNLAELRFTIRRCEEILAASIELEVAFLHVLGS